MIFLKDFGKKSRKILKIFLKILFLNLPDNIKINTVW